MSCGLWFRLITGWSLLVGLTAPGRASDVFDRHQLVDLKRGFDQAEPVIRLTLQDVARIKSLAPNISSPCIVVKTHDGNIAKALVGWGLRKRGEVKTPVVVLERFVTYRIDRPELTTAAGKDVMLFPGFGFSFDIGQVVPVDQGADLALTADGALEAVGDAKLVPLNGSQLTVMPGARPDPLDHDGVLPRDFAGRWRVDADGRWKGEWELTIDDAERLAGTFVSDELQNRYEILGQLGGVPHLAKFTITLANAQMQVDAYLWTKDKSRMAGTITMVGRKFGFAAERLPESE